MNKKTPEKKEKPFYSDSDESVSEGKKQSNLASSSPYKEIVEIFLEDEDRKNDIEKEQQEEDDEFFEDDEAFFSSKSSEASADDELKNKKLDESKKISELFTNDFLDKDQALKDLIGNDDVRTVQDVINKRKMEMERKERFEKEKEARAQRKALLKRPIEYTNLIKVYVICFLFKFMKITELAYSTTNRAYLLSKLPDQPLRELEAAVSFSDGSFDEKIKKVLKFFGEFFRYRKMNESAYLINMASGFSFTHLQINQLFLGLLHFLKFPTRLCYIVDLRHFKLDKRLKTLPNAKEANKVVKSKKRSFDDLRSQNLNEYKQAESKIKLKGRSLLDLCISSILEENSCPQTNMMSEPVLIKEEDNEEFMKIEESEEISRQEDSSNGPEELEDLFDKFKFKSTPKNEAKATSSQPSKGTPNNKTLHNQTIQNLKKIEDEDLGEMYSFKRKGAIPSDKSPSKGQTEQIQEPKPSVRIKAPYEYDFVRPGKNGDPYDYDEYNYWVEVFDIETNRWVAIDPIKKELGNKDHEMITKKMIGNSNLFIIANTFLSEREMKHKGALPVKGLLFADITQYYCEKWAKVLISRKQISLKFWWDDFLKSIRQTRFIKSPLWKHIFQKDHEILQLKMKLEIPSNYNEMRNSSYYIIPSMLKKYQGIHPSAVPVDFKFKEEEVFKREDLVELHTRSKWLNHGRKVKKGEKSLKQVLALTGNGERMVDLFGEWQTELWENKLNEDGSLPRNEYGNYEMFNGKPPEGTMHIDLPGLPRILKKHEIDHVEAVIGFERGKSGRSHVIKSGVLAFVKDEERIRKLYEENRLEIEQKQKEKERKETLSCWKKLLELILIKKQVKELYNDTTI